MSDSHTKGGIYQMDMTNLVLYCSSKSQVLNEENIKKKYI